MTIPTSKSEANEALKENFVEVKFTKADGTTRTMVATLLPMVINHVANKNGHSTSRVVTVPDHQIRCIDAEIGEWRSFKLDSITSFKPIEYLMKD